MKTFEKIALICVIAALVCAFFIFAAAVCVDSYFVADGLYTETGKFIFGMTLTCSFIPLISLFVVACMPIWCNIEALDEKNF